MKKLISILFLSIVAFASLQAQHLIGVRGGYNVSDVIFDKFNSHKTETYSSNNYGLSYKYYQTKYVGMQVELNLVKSGYRYKESDTTYVRKKIEIPVFAHGRVNFGPIGFFINAGCFLGYATNNEKEFDTKTGRQKFGCSFSGRDLRWEFAVGGGLGVSFDILKHIEIIADARYKYGLTYLYKPRYKDCEVEYIQPTSIQFSVGIFYKFGKQKNFKVRDIQLQKQD